jgi:hypothetical protein
VANEKLQRILLNYQSILFFSTAIKSDVLIVTIEPS